MADDSPGKVQALRAMFSEKNNPVMGLMPPPGGKYPGLPRRPLDSIPAAQEPPQPSALKEKQFIELSLGCNNKVLPTHEKGSSLFGEKQNYHRPVAVSKPAVGPKPTFLLQQRVSSSEFVNSGSGRTAVREDSKSRAFGETIASFMFASNKENENSGSSPADSPPPPVPPVPKPRITEQEDHVEVMNFCNSYSSSKSGSGVSERDRGGRCCSVISSDNYVCRVRRKELPDKEKLGPAPLKPVRPAHMRLPSDLSCGSFVPQTQQVSKAPPAPNQRTVSSSLQRPSYPCPPRPVTSPPLPPVTAPVIKPPPTSLREEIEELYEDTLLRENKRPVSLIPEYTEEEEQAELYHDATDAFEEKSTISDSSLKYKKPPPLVPSEYLQPNMNGSNEELYQDADGITQEEFYEVMPCDEIKDDSESPLYSNNKREIEKLRKEEEKRIRREQKEKEKREKELEKLRKKFGLTGEEIPIDDGLVKWDSRGGKGDLPVKKGETVLILRMEGNPSGRWLVKNEKGKIGYVELTNIEVDPLSVKSVMSIRRLSVISAGEELYCEAKSEEEAIYEVTY